MLRCLVLSFVYTAVALEFSGDLIRVNAFASTCNVLTYGAKGDGRTDDTKAVQAAITACTGTAGGTVLLPSPYTFLTFAIYVPKTASSFALVVDGNWRFNNDSSKWPGTAPCLLFEGGSNIALVGSGVVDGNGAAWWPNKSGFRPGLVTMQGVVNALIANISFKDSPNHQLEIYASPAEITHVSITAPPSTAPVPSHNTDGIDVHGDNFYVHDSYISTGDDNVAIHASNVLITRVTFGTGHGASIGSLGGAIALQNITVSDCTFTGTEAGVRIKTDSGSTGFLKGVTYANLQMSGVQETVSVCMFYDVDGDCNYPGSTKGGKPGTTLAITDLSISNITAHDSTNAGQFTCDPKAPCGPSISISGVVHTGTAPQPWACANAHLTGGSGAPNFPALAASCV